jgi:hypothetical protein
MHTMGQFIHVSSTLRIFLATLFMTSLSFLCIPAQTPYMKNIKTDNMVHMMGKSILDGQGIRFGGFINEAPSSGSQETHTINIYEYTHPTNSAVTVRFTVDATSTDTFAYTSYMDSINGCEYYLGYLPYDSCIQHLPPASSLISTSVASDYDMFCLKADENLQVAFADLIGTDRMEQNPYYIETGEQTLGKSPSGDFWLGATRSDVYSGPTDLVISRITPSHSVSWMKTIGVNTNGNSCYVGIYSEQLMSLLGMRNGNVLATFIFRGQGVPGYHMMLDDQGNFEWCYAYSMDGEATYINGTVEDALPGSTDLAIVGHVIVAPYMSRLDICFAKITPGSPPVTVTKKRYTAYDSAGSGHYLIPNQMVQSEDDYYICGIAENMSTHLPLSYVIKIDGDNGNILWQNCFNVGNRSEALVLSVQANGNVWVAGNTDLEQNTPFSSWKNFYLAELNGHNGNILRAHYYDEDHYQSCVDLLAPQTGEHIDRSQWRRTELQFHSCGADG